MRWTMEQVAGALGVALPSALDPMARLAGVSIDSRTVAPGQLFIAIRGPRHDGHDFVSEVLERGIPAAIVESARRPSYSEAIQARLFGVEDTLQGMQQLAAASPALLARSQARTPRGSRRRLGGKNDHQRNSGGAAGRAVPRSEIDRQFEQRLWIAADAVPARRRARRSGGGTGHVAARRTCAADAHRSARCRRGDARDRRASRILQLD